MNDRCLKMERYFGFSNIEFNYNIQFVESVQSKYFNQDEINKIKVVSKYYKLEELIEFENNQHNLKGAYLRTNYCSMPNSVPNILDIYLIPINNHYGITINRGLVEYTINKYINPFIDYIVYSLNFKLYNPKLYSPIIKDDKIYISMCDWKLGEANNVCDIDTNDFICTKTKNSYSCIHKLTNIVYNIDKRCIEYK